MHDQLDLRQPKSMHRHNLLTAHDLHHLQLALPSEDVIPRRVIVSTHKTARLAHHLHQPHDMMSQQRQERHPQGLLELVLKLLHRRWHLLPDLLAHHPQDLDRPDLLHLLVRQRYLRGHQTCEPVHLRLHVVAIEATFHLVVTLQERLPVDVEALVAHTEVEAVVQLLRMAGSTMLHLDHPQALEALTRLHLHSVKAPTLQAVPIHGHSALRLMALPFLKALVMHQMALASHHIHI